MWPCERFGDRFRCSVRRLKRLRCLRRDSGKLSPPRKGRCESITKANEFPNGALSLGDAHADGPVTNWASDGGMIESFFDGQILPYPVQELPFPLGQSSDTLRIGWGEAGIYHEGLYPWWSGQIFVR